MVKMRKILAFLFFMTVLTTVSAEMFDLTIAEKEFLKRHSVLRVGNELDWPPYDFAVDGQAKGLFVDYMEILAEFIGVEIQWVNGYTWPELLSLMEKGELDILPAVGYIPDRESYLLHSIPYSRAHMGWANLKKDGNEIKLIDLHNQTFAFPQGWGGLDYILESYPDSREVIVSGPDQGFEAVMKGDASFYLDDFGSLAYQVLRKYPSDLFNIGAIPLVDETSTNLHVGINKSISPLRDIINKAIALVPPEKHKEIQNKWLGWAPMIESLFIDYGALTIKERNWLDEHPKIRAHILTGVPPISFNNEKGEYSGIAADYVLELEKLLGIDIELVDQIDWSTSLKQIASGELDMITAIADTAERRDDMLFSTDYIVDPVGLYALTGRFAYRGMDDLYGYKIVSVRGYAVNAFLDRDLPGLDLVLTDSYEEAFKLLKRRKADIFVSDIFSANYFLESGRFGGISFIGMTPYEYKVSMAVRSDWPIFRNILSKALTRLIAEKRQQIETRWFFTEMEGYVNLEYLIFYFIIGALVFLILFVWLFFQNRLNKQLHEQSTHDSLTGLRNLRELNEIYKDQTGRAERFNLNLVFLILDLDYFKLYNDTYGHVEGDELLKRFGALLKACFKRPDDFCFRLGGEEFGCLFLIDGKTDPFSPGEKFRKALLEKNWTHKGNKVYEVVTVSGGMSVLEPGSNCSFENLYRSADEALYRAKQEGRNRIFMESGR